MSQTLLDLLTVRFPTAKRTTFRQMIQSRRVMINGRPARSLKDSVEATDHVEVHPHAPREKPPAPTLTFPIVHEDEDILVIDKPAGLLTSTVPREKRPTALAMVREYVKQRDGARARARVGLIHRLDRDASGLLVFSKNDPAYASLKTQFFRHTVERVYAAIVRGKLTPPAGRISSRLMELPDGRVVTTRQHAKGQEAVTDYTTLRTAGKLSLLEVKLETGRKHQIRAHLVERGAPILNDPMYDRDAQPSGRLMLAAVRLALDHPRTGKRLTFHIDPPREMTEIFPAEKPEHA